MSEHDPTALMQRDKLQKMLEASTQPVTAQHVVPRALADRRPVLGDPDEVTVSPGLVLGLIALLIALFVLIVQTSA